MYVLFHESTSQIRLHHEKSRLTSPEFLEFNFNTAYGNGESSPIYTANEVEQMGAYSDGSGNFKFNILGFGKSVERKLNKIFRHFSQMFIHYLVSFQCGGGTVEH